MEKLLPVCVVVRSTLQWVLYLFDFYSFNKMLFGRKNVDLCKSRVQEICGLVCVVVYAECTFELLSAMNHMNLSADNLH